MKTGSQLVWRPDPLVTRCGRESQHPAEWAPGLRLSSPGERDRHNADGHKSGGQYVAVLFGLQLPLTVKPWVSLFEPFRIKWEVYFSKRRQCRLSSSLCRCVLRESAYDYTTLGTVLPMLLLVVLTCRFLNSLMACCSHLSFSDFDMCITELLT